MHDLWVIACAQGHARARFFMDSLTLSSLLPYSETLKETSMLDIKLIRKDPKTIEARLRTKDPEIRLASILALDEKMRELLVKVEHLKSSRNQLSKEIGEKKRVKEDTTALMKEVAGMGDQITMLDHELTQL